MNMEIFLLVVVIILIVLILVKNNQTNNDLLDLRIKLGQLINEFKNFKIQNQISQPTEEDYSENQVTPEKSQTQEVVVQQVVSKTDIEKTSVPANAEIEESQIVEEIPVSDTIIVEEQINTQEEQTSQVDGNDSTPKETINNTSETQSQQKIKEPQPSFFERHPDIEKFIGENLINKIGIAILVLGIGFFVKFAIDKEWINEIGRVFIGILCGGTLLGFAHKLKSKFKSFSSVLVGGGMAVLYFTIAIAFHEYQIFSQTVAFLIMVVITSFTILLSIAYDRREIAVLGMLGGFGTPFMLSTGEGNYVVLFTYLLILNSGILVLAFYKKWRILNIIAYIFTLLIFGGWLGSELNNSENFPYLGSLIFATCFYFLFFAMNIVKNIIEKMPFKALDFGILLSNTLLYFTAGMCILQDYNDGLFMGLFTAFIAVFNFVFVYLLRKNINADKSLLYMLIGLVLTFVSLAAPVQLNGNYITLFWACETLLLLWLSQKSGIKIIKISSVLVMILMIISQIMDWNAIYDSYSENILTPIFNKGFITSLFSLCAIAGTILLLKKEKETSFIGEFKVNVYSGILTTLFIIFLYVAGILELDYQLNQYFLNYIAIKIALGLFNLMYIIALFIYVNLYFKTEKVILKLITALGLVGMFSYLFYYNWEIVDARDYYLLNYGSALRTFMFHYLITVSALVITYLSYLNVKRIFDKDSIVTTIYTWFVCFVLMFILSQELDHISIMIGFNDSIPIETLREDNHMIGYPLLWGIFSFIFMVVGLKRGIKNLRIISLALFLVTLLKLFIFDISRIPEGGRILAFISLGVLLLIVSFMYQKLKNLILTDEKEENKEITNKIDN